MTRWPFRYTLIGVTAFSAAAWLTVCFFPLQAFLVLLVLGIIAAGWMIYQHLRDTRQPAEPLRYRATDGKFTKGNPKTDALHAQLRREVEAGKGADHV